MCPWLCKIKQKKLPEEMCQWFLWVQISHSMCLWATECGNWSESGTLPVFDCVCDLEWAVLSLSAFGQKGLNLHTGGSMVYTGTSDPWARGMWKPFNLKTKPQTHSCSQYGWPVPPSVAAFSDREFVWPTERRWSYIKRPTPTNWCVKL